MRLEQHADAEREVRRLGDGPLHRVDVRENFLDVGVGRLAAGAELEDLCERGLRTLDHGGGHSLAQEVRADEQAGVGEELPNACETAESSLGFGEQRHEPRGQLERSRQRRGEVRDVRMRADRFASAAEGGVREGRGVHSLTVRDSNDRRNLR